MTAEAWGERLTPAFGETARRFPFPIILAAIATAIFLVISNEGTGGETELWFRTFAGLATAAFFALAGNMFAESRPQSRNAALVLTYLVPSIAGVLLQIRDTPWFVPWALPAIAILWLSVSTTITRDSDSQARFWWINFRAIAAAAIAAIAVAIIFTGLGAIERTVGALFGFDLSTLIYRNLFPVIALLLAPLYWLATLPRLSDYDPRILTTPDFLARAVGLVGKFVLIPLLLAYAAILLLYCAQIAVTQQLPQGTLGWMVLGFVVAGAGTWLILYPPFVADSQIVRFFHRAWFWLTLLPLALFFLAVWIRLDNYGLTPERLILMWAGIWAALVTLIFLFRRGDIRLIPGLAAVILTVATIGPWNLDNLPQVRQAATLDNLLPITGPNGESYGVIPSWTPAEKAKAEGAIGYLIQSEQGKDAVRAVLRNKGFDLTSRHFGIADVEVALGVLVLDPLPPSQPYLNLTRANERALDLSSTPVLLGAFQFDGSAALAAGPLTLAIYDTDVTVKQSGPAAEDTIRADLTHWLAMQKEGQPIAAPVIRFTSGGRAYAFVVDHVEIAIGRAGAEAPNIVSIGGSLFAALEPVVKPSP